MSIPTAIDCTCAPKADHRCPWHGFYPDGSFCGDCDEYLHYCGGCGEVVKHWQDSCADGCPE